MHHPTDRIAHTAAFDAPVVEYWLGREMVQCENIAICAPFALAGQHLLTDKEIIASVSTHEHIFLV